MTKNELMEMAEKHGGLLYMLRGTRDQLEEVSFEPHELVSFVNAILERAAEEIEPKNDRSDWTVYAIFAYEKAKMIRALKIDNQAQSAAAHKGGGNE